MDNFLNVSDSTKEILTIVGYGLLGLQYFLRVVGRIYKFMQLRKRDGSCKEGVSLLAETVWIVISVIFILATLIFVIIEEITVMLAGVIVVMEIGFIVVDIAYILYYRRIRRNCKKTILPL